MDTTTVKKLRRTLRPDYELQNNSSLWKKTDLFLEQDKMNENDDECSDTKKRNGKNIKNIGIALAPSHPLLISLILDAVFDYQDLITLKQCRLVCKSWKEAASQDFKRMSICNPIQFEMSCNKRKTQLKVFGEAAFIKNDIFLQKYPSGSLPFDKIILSADMLMSDYGAVTTSCWLQKYGVGLKGIQYLLVRESSASSPSPLQKILTQWCPKIEELEILRCIHFQYLNLDLSEQQLPNIKKLVFLDNFDGLSSSIKRNISSDLKAIPQIDALFKASCHSVEYVEVSVEQPRCSYSIVTAIKKYAKNLKTLVWKNVLYTRDLKEIIVLSTKTSLKKLELDCFLFAVPTFSDDITTIFRNFSDSLEVLKINGHIIEEWGAFADLDSDSDDGNIENEDNNNPEVVNHPNNNNRGGIIDQYYLNFFNLKFPEMEKLIVLEIQDIFHCRIGILSEFIQKLPNLKKLKLTNVIYASDVRPLRPDEVLAELLQYNNNIIVNFPPQNKLEELHLEGEIMNVNGIITLSRLFPKLKILNVFINSDIVFAEVFKRFRFLQELNLRFRGILDMHWCESIFVFHLSEMYDLRKLKLHHDSTYPLQLTEKSVLRGFKQAESLRYLEFNNFSISINEREAVLHHLRHLTSLTFKDCELHTPKFNASYVSGTPCKDEPFPKF